MKYFKGEPTLYECPASHPYAYLKGDYCCKTSLEKIASTAHEKCDGSMISFESSCCENDAWFTCSTKGSVDHSQPIIQKVICKRRRSARSGPRYRVRVRARVIGDVALMVSILA